MRDGSQMHRLATTKYMFVDLQKEQQLSTAAYQQQLDKHAVELQREQQHAAMLAASVAQLKAQAKVRTFAWLPQLTPPHPFSTLLAVPLLRACMPASSCAELAGMLCTGACPQH